MEKKVVLESKRTSPKAILLVFFSTLINASAQFAYKMGSNQAAEPISLLTNFYVWTGLVLYGLSALMLIVALKYGELSILYPVIATSFIWVNLIAYYFFNEDVNLLKWAGCLFILSGIAVLGFAEKAFNRKVSRVVA